MKHSEKLGGVKIAVMGEIGYIFLGIHKFISDIHWFEFEYYLKFPELHLSGDIAH